MRKMSETEFKDLPNKPLEDWTEEEIKEIFLDLFFWVADNRPSWLREAIERKKRYLTNPHRKEI